MKREESLFLKDILESINNIEEFSRELSKEQFVKNKLKQSAIVRQFEIIGEAVKNISDATRTKYPEIEWRKIAGVNFHECVVAALNCMKRAFPADIICLTPNEFNRKSREITIIRQAVAEGKILN